MVALNPSAKTYYVLRYVTYLMFDGLRSLILNCNFNLRSDGWIELPQYVLNRGQLLRVFQNLPDSLVLLFKVTRPLPPRPPVIELDKDGMLVNQLPP